MFTYPQDHLYWLVLPVFLLGLLLENWDIFLVVWDDTCDFFIAMGIFAPSHAPVGHRFCGFLLLALFITPVVVVESQMLLKVAW